MINAKQIFKAAIILTGLMFSAVSNAAVSNLITNGTFDSDLSGWVVAVGDQGTGVTWDSGAANVGQVGPNGFAMLSQSITTPASADKFLISFDYQWEAGIPSGPTNDFKVDLVYQVGGSETTQDVLFQSNPTSEDGFNTNIHFSRVFDLNGLQGDIDNLDIQFMLTESNTGVGTRIALDNVSISAVPLPAAAWLFGSTILGFVGFSRKKKTQLTAS